MESQREAGHWHGETDLSLPSLSRCVYSMESLLFSPPLLVVVVAAVASVAFLLSSRLIRERKPRRRYHPVVSTVVHQLLNFRRIFDYHTDLSRRHKSFRILSGPFQSDVYTNDPAVVEHILRSNFSNYGKGTYCHDIMKDLTGDGMFGVDGAKWRHQRKLASNEFSTRALREHSGAVLKKNAQKFAEVMSDAAASHQMIEIQGLLLKSSMDSIFEVAFGVDLSCLQGSTKADSIFVEALDELSMLTCWRTFNPFWKLMKFLNIGSEASLRNHAKVVNDYVYKLIQTRVEQLAADKRDGSCIERDDIMSRFLFESEKDPETMNRKYLRDITLNFIIAGRDTTAGTLAWFFYMICKHPSVQEKIAQEIKAAVTAGGGEAATFQEFAASITEESLAKMQYLHAALNETLRLYPPASNDPKVCFSDDTLPDGFSIKKGEIIQYQAYAMGRMKYLWGEDAEIFRPERWLDANGMFRPESPVKFTAFQAGPRLCLGKEFAYRQMKIHSAMLLHFFVFELWKGKETVNYKITLTLLVDEGVHLQVTPRCVQQPM